ncbi:MFS transporter [Plantactinospora sp. S1510]|uniref:MFS transporter n=1 Tax=Plantactinospora alkalitolerans TaxID=2789879 RepID=A0ABS0GPF7_9ACTN|nr:MFS transporter [Plantactinospora alkalitolerans]MBF9128068.1 MFS transporter [Plantactinospora alkalitolerans]
MHTLDVAGGSRATRREWTALAVLTLPTLLLSLDISVLYLALPHLSGDLDANGVEQLWILDIYGFLLAGFLVTMGKLGDRIGRRKLLLVGGAAFGVVSILAAYSTSATMLIASRALLGLVGATLMPSMMALIRNMFHDPVEMARAIAIWFACFMTGVTVGPLVGGALLEHFWWGSVFLLGVPFMALLLVFGPVLLPEYRDPHAGGLDLLSVLLSLMAILPTIYGLKSLTRSGASLVAVTAIVVGAAAGTGFVRRQRKLENPLLDLRLFRAGAFSTALSTMWFGGVVMAGVSLVSAMYLQLVQGFSPLAAGLWLIPQNLAMIIGSVLAPRFVKSFHASRVIAAGLVVSAVGLLTLTFVRADHGLPLLVAGLVLASFGMSLPMALSGAVVMGSAPPEKAGSAAAVLETSGEFGVAVGIATLGSLATYVYRSEVADGVPADLPADVAGAINDNLAVAVSAGQESGGRFAAELLTMAQAAFVSGLNVVSAVGVVVFLALAALCVRLPSRAGVPGAVGSAAGGTPIVASADRPVPVDSSASR